MKAPTIILLATLMTFSFNSFSQDKEYAMFKAHWQVGGLKNKMVYHFYDNDGGREEVVDDTKDFDQNSDVIKRLNKYAELGWGVVGFFENDNESTYFLLERKKKP